MADHQSILSQKIKDIKDVPMLPEGSYLATISGTPKVGNFGQKNTPGAEFSFKLNSPLDDVDPEMLGAAGGIPDMPMTYTFWDTPKAGGILREFLDNVIQADAEQSPLEIFPELAGTQVVVVINHSENKKTGRKYAQINKFARA
jgi:hypothetical protein